MPPVITLTSTLFIATLPFHFRALLNLTTHNHLATPRIPLTLSLTSIILIPRPGIPHAGPPGPYIPTISRSYNDDQDLLCLYGPIWYEYVGVWGFAVHSGRESQFDMPGAKLGRSVAAELPETTWRLIEWGRMGAEELGKWRRDILQAVEGCETDEGVVNEEEDEEMRVKETLERILAEIEKHLERLMVEKNGGENNVTQDGDGPDVKDDIE